MSDDDPNRGGNFEEIAKALAEEVSRAFERISDIDVDELARTASAEGERARQWIDDIGRWLREQAAGAAGGAFPGAAWDEPPASAPAPSAAPADDPLKHAGPHPLDLPTAEPGTSTLAAHGEGPGPRDALGLVRELRVRDWLSADGEITLAGRNALRRWLEASGGS
jgi:hypothetical protein